MLDRLPSEIIDQILTLLQPPDIARCMPTCQLLLKHALRDSIWQRFAQSYLSKDVRTPAPYRTWIDLYKNNHLHLFLVKHKLWFSDLSDHGRLIMAYWDPRRGCVEAYQLRANTGVMGDMRAVTLNGQQIFVKLFRPTIWADTNSAILRLSAEDYLSPRSKFSEHRSVGGAQLRSEVHMNVSRTASAMDRMMTQFLFSVNLPERLCDEQTDLWPPMTFPSPNNGRTRRTSHNGYRAKGHAPERLEQLSETSFRIRNSLTMKNMHPILSSLHFPGEETETFGTISASAYTPTPEKPWQGIWVGDYSAHNAEFVLITQPDVQDARPLPDKCRSAFANWPRTTPYQALFQNAVPDEPEEVYEYGLVSPGNLTSALEARNRRESIGRVPPVRPGALPESTDDYPYRGRIEAMKLTGDPNVPRGELTFVADDIGTRGLIGHTKEPDFVDPDIAEKLQDGTLSEADWQGTRMVKSCGHVADLSPRRDSYIPAQLIMVSPNILAQWWIAYKYVVFYHRVDLSELLSS